jgi:septal ring factor EnvC (AmiA/AmiB activator)
MTPEERWERIDRLVEFLAANQAQLSASSHAHDAQIAENAKLIAENAKQIAEHSKQIAEHSKQIGQLGDLILRIGRIVEEQGRRIDDGFARLAESQRRTDERLNALINVVERYFSDGRH